MSAAGPALDVRELPDHHLVQMYCTTRAGIEELDSKIKKSEQMIRSRDSTRETHRLNEELDTLREKRREASCLLTICEDELFKTRIMPTAKRIVRLHVFGNGAIPKNVENLDRTGFCEDAEGETLKNIVQGICGFEGDASLSTWMTKIAANTLTTLIRKYTGRGREKRIFERIERTSEDPRGSVLTEPPFVKNPERTIELRIAIQQAFEAYTEQSNSHLLSMIVMDLRTEGYSSKDISAQTGKTPAAVDQIHSRDIRKHRAHFRKLGILPGLG